MSRCDEGVVRTLFDEHGGDTLTAKDILDVMDSYTAKCGAPIVDGEVALQITTFARENSSLAIGVDEFLSMIRSLENETDSSTDDGSNASLFEGKQGSATPDTTLDSVAPESPAKHRSAFAPRTPMPLPASTSRIISKVPVTSSEPDVAGITARSALIRKLARVNEQLDRLHSDHQILSHEKKLSDATCTSLQREINGLRRDLEQAHSHGFTLESRVHELEASITQIKEDRDTQRRSARQLDTHLQQQMASFSDLEKQEAEHVAQLTSLQTTCQAYVTDLHGLRATCDAQREAISGLEGIIHALERVHSDAEQLQQEVDHSRKIHEQLEQELRALHDVSEQPGPVLAEDLAPFGEWTSSPEEPVSDVHDHVAPTPSTATAPDPPTGTLTHAAEAQTAHNGTHDTPPARLLWSLMVHLLLVTTGIWLGLWIYHFSMLIMPAHVYQQLLDKRWFEANMLDDALQTPLSTTLWQEHYVSRFS